MEDWEQPLTKAARPRAHHDQVALETLEALCETSTPISLMAAHLPLSSAGHLRSVSPEGVVAHLPHPPRSPLQGALVALSFPLAGKSAGFTGPIMRVDEHPDGSMNVTLRVPERIQLTMRRAAVRVPVPAGTMTAAIVHGERRQPVVPIDLSLRGVLIEFREDEAPDLGDGRPCMVELSLASKSVQLEAEVRRRDGPRHGMAFIIGEERPRKLAAIIMELQHLASERTPR